jgi:hypothetical protein
MNRLLKGRCRGCGAPRLEALGLVPMAVVGGGPGLPSSATARRTRWGELLAAPRLRLPAGRRWSWTRPEAGSPQTPSGREPQPARNRSRFCRRPPALSGRPVRLAPLAQGMARARPLQAMVVGGARSPILREGFAEGGWVQPPARRERFGRGCCERFATLPGRDRARPLHAMVACGARSPRILDSSPLGTTGEGELSPHTGRFAARRPQPPGREWAGRAAAGRGRGGGSLLRASAPRELPSASRTHACSAARCSRGAAIGSIHRERRAVPREGAPAPPPPRTGKTQNPHRRYPRPAHRRHAALETRSAPGTAPVALPGEARRRRP